jgi:hypothetical protein
MGWNSIGFDDELIAALLAIHVNGNRMWLHWQWNGNERASNEFIFMRALYSILIHSAWHSLCYSVRFVQQLVSLTPRLDGHLIASDCNGNGIDTSIAME